MTSFLGLMGNGFWIAFAVAALLARPVHKALVSWKSRQTISQYAPEGHQAKQGTPTMGGLIIIFGYLAGVIYTASAAASLSGDRSLIGAALGDPTAWFFGWLVLFVGFAAIGFIDDFVVPRIIAGKRGLGWKQKIVMQLFVAVLGVGLIHGGTVDVQAAIAVFLILFFSNAYNFSDGLDGLAGSILLALAGGLSLLAVLSPLGTPLTLVLVPLLGAVIPFLFLNAPPARIFMGDVGSLPIGAVLGMGVASLGTGIGLKPGLVSGNDLIIVSPSGMWAALLIISLVMVIELVPVPLQILSVKVRKKRLFPYTPVHHAFEKAGWPESRVVWMFALTQLLASALAVYIYVQASAMAEPPGRHHYYYFSSELGSSR
jgi:phospho-N-acetylmuramoyl-pentapeptide-transferase